MLLTAQQTQLAAPAFIHASGEVFAVFGEDTQDSGNVSYGVAVGERRVFVKTAGADAPAPTLPRDHRIALLRNAIQLNRTVSHKVLPILRNVVESEAGPILVYDWVDGELLGSPASQRSDPRSTFLRFRRLPVPHVLEVLDAILDLHRVLTAAGWIAVDFYDGSLIYDFHSHNLHVVDLDHYHHGPFVNRMGRMFGSTRFMAPEEFELGAQIDESTNVYVLGRTVLELLSDGSEHKTFRGPPDLLRIAQRACLPARQDRYNSVNDFYTAWKAERDA
ncbi:MAG: serine/threonine protein kinase [Longimicrobiales bacterium]